MPVSPVPATPRPGSCATVVGGGPAGLIAAEVLAGAGVQVTVVDRMPSVGRKLLMAGHGGLNITHSEARDTFLPRYGGAADRLAPIIEDFTPDDLRAWCAGLGEPTFVGSSRRVFPESFRANRLVRAWLGRLGDQGVELRTRRRWSGWDPDGGLLLVDDEGARSTLAGDVVVLALGGASWPSLGSDGSWVPLVQERGVAVTPLRPANVGLRVDWSTTFADRFAGSPLKHVALGVRGRPDAPSRGDAMVTATGIEGGPVYAIGASLRRSIDAGSCVLEVDLRPDVGVAELADRLGRRRTKDSVSTWLRRCGLDPVAISLLRESVGVRLPTDAVEVARLVKAVAVPVTGTMPIERAISTAGGIAWSDVDERLMLRAVPGTFVAGEMLDWEAPTGGYLLQASFSTGVVAAHGALAWLEGSRAEQRPTPDEDDLREVGARSRDDSA